MGVIYTYLSTHSQLSTRKKLQKISPDSLKFPVPLSPPVTIIKKNPGSGDSAVPGLKR